MAQGYAEAFEALTEQLRGFVRDRRCRLLHVVTPAGLRRRVVEAAMAAEHAPEGVEAFVGFAQDSTRADAGWARRSEAAREQHARRRAQASDDEAASIPALDGATPTDRSPVGFATQLGQLAACGPEHCEGVVAVLAPEQVEDPATWREAIGRLCATRRDATVRFIVVEAEPGTLDPVVDALDGRGVRHEVAVAADAGTSALARILAGAHGAGPSGATPPPRPDVPQGEASPELQRRKAVGDKVLEGVLAMGSGDAAAAVAAQREARDLCTAAGWTEDAAQMELLLGGQLAAAGRHEAAEQTFAAVLDRAREAELPGKATTAGFALGATRSARREKHTALVAFAEAAVEAERTDDPMLAIEGNRLAAQAAADIKMEPQAITFFTRAVKLAESAPAHILPRTSAAHAARGLAAICRRRRLGARADELEAQARRFESAEEAAAAPPPALPEGPPLPSTPALDEAPVAADAAGGDEAESTALLPVHENLPARATPDAPPVLGPLSPLGDAPEAGTQPPVFGALPSLGPATPDDFGEGTSMMTLEEIADLHWGGDTTPPDDARPWTPAEIETLQHAVNEALEPEATLMLSPVELSALRGESTGLGRQEAATNERAPAPPPRLDAPAEPDVPAGLEPLPGLEPVPDEDAPRPSAPRPSAPRSDTGFDPDEVTIMTLDEVAALRDAVLKAKRGKPEDDDEEDGR